MDLTFEPGEQVFVNGRQVVVVSQVLFNRPAYRVRLVRSRSNMPTEEWVVDGFYLSDDPNRRVGLMATEEPLAAEQSCVVQEEGCELQSVK